MGSQTSCFRSHGYPRCEEQIQEAGGFSQEAGHRSFRPSTLETNKDLNHLETKENTQMDQFALLAQLRA
jgi:hypothetical protein